MRSLTQIAGAQRGQGCLTLPDLMQQLQRVQSSEFALEAFLDRGWDRGMSQEPVTGDRGLVIPLVHPGAVAGLGLSLNDGWK